MPNAPRTSRYERPTLEPDWEEARRFHGHLGPWLALGMKMGEEAMRLLRATPHFGVRVEVACRLAPPVSCLIDGLQWMTGATYGKRNVLAEESPDVRVRVTNTETEAALDLAPLPGTVEAMIRWLAEMGDEAASRHVYAQPASELFSAQPVSGARDGAR
jgi:formylmethanofuran dehydrogenase subunit E